MSWAHFADIGGLRAGSISPDATDIFQEGIIVPPTKLIDAGRTNEAALAIFHPQFALPRPEPRRHARADGERGARRDARRGDRRALRRRRRGGRAAPAARAHAPPGARALAETFAYGTHSFTDAIDSDGHGNGPFRSALPLTRESGPDGEDRFIFDATATDDQAAGPVNLLMNPGVPGMALGLFYLGGDPAQVCNAGGPQALDEVRLREGSLLWPRFPGAARHARPDHDARARGAERPGQRGRRQGAGGAFGLCHHLDARHLAQREGELEPFLLADGIGVGYGARPFADGIDAVYFVAQENYPVEFLEPGYPVRLRPYGIVDDTGGAGRYRGGCGIVREYEILAEEAVLAVRIDSVKYPPWGIAGGMSGGAGRAVVNPGTPQERVLAPLSDGNKLKRGDILRIETGGGGGHGHPHDRPPEEVLGRARRLRHRRGRAAALRRRRRDGFGRQGRHRGAARERPETKAFHRNEYVDALADTSLAVAVDIGGTFTDIALHDPASGTLWRAKTPSVPADPSQAFIAGMILALEEAGRAAPRWAACCTARPSPPT